MGISGERWRDTSSVNSHTNGSRRIRSLYIHPANHSPIRQVGGDGLAQHWILEIHFVDPRRQIGAFFEELLTVG